MPNVTKPLDPLSLATNLLNSGRTRAALLKAVEERVKADPEERRRFAAAAARVYGLLGEQALTQAVRNYLQDLTRSSQGDRTATLLWLEQTVASISGTSAGRGMDTAATDRMTDPRAAAEALFRPRASDAPLTPAA